MYTPYIRYTAAYECCNMLYDDILYICFAIYYVLCGVYSLDSLGLLESQGIEPCRTTRISEVSEKLGGPGSGKCRLRPPF